MSIFVFISVSVSIYIYVYNGILLSHKKKEVLPFAVTWTCLKDIVLSEISQTKTDKHRIVSLVYEI